MELLLVILNSTCNEASKGLAGAKQTNEGAAYHEPRQSSKLARIDPNMAALITWTFESPLEVLSNTMNKMISTTEPNVVSRTTAKALFGIFRENSWPAKPSKLAAGNMAM